VRKGGDEGDARLIYQQRGEERRGSEWASAAAGLPFMAGGYAGVKEQEEGGNSKKLKGIWSWWFIALIGALGKKGEVEEAGRRGGDYGGHAAEQRKGRGAGGRKR
jgi:hypothetical protein